MSGDAVVTFKDKGCDIKLSKSLVHGLGMQELVAKFESWMKESLVVGYNNISRNEKKEFPDFDVRLPEPDPVPDDRSEASSSDWEDDIASKTPAKKGAKSQAYATPSAKSPSKIPVPVSRTPQAVASSIKVKSARSTSSNRGTASKCIPNILPPVSTGRSQRSTSRLKQPASASKLTESAVKRKLELDKERALLLQQQMREKEEKAARQRQQNLVTMVVEHKQKREEKERKVAKTREQLEKEANEKRLRESTKKKEADRRRREIEESRRALLKRSEDTEAEKRAAEAAAARRAADEERAKREAQEAQIAKQIHDRIQQIHQQKQHNQSASTSLSTSLAHRMLASSFISQSTTQATAAPADTHTSLISEDGDDVTSASETPAIAVVEVPDAAVAAPANQTFNMNVTVNGNLTFNVPPAGLTSETNGATAGITAAPTAGTTSGTSSAPLNDSMLPPPVPPAPKLASYDISDLNSDAESDDERNPRKVIPDWAKGTNFVQSLTSQYQKVRKLREREILKTFRLCPTTVDLDDIFKGYTRQVIPKYVKRTSSAHWSSPPASKMNFSDSFWANASFSKSILEQKD